MKQNYVCICCGYSTGHRSSMYNHFYKKKKPCPKIVNDIELTEDIKQYILDNRVYKIPLSKPVPAAESNELIKVRSMVKKLTADINILKNNTKKNERFYQAILEKHFGHGHMTTDAGITDITTPEFHAEIKHWTTWKQAVGQLCMYNLSEPRPEKRVYMFGSVTPEIRQTAMNGFLSMNIAAYEISATNDEYTITNLADGNVETHPLFD